MKVTIFRSAMDTAVDRHCTFADVYREMMSMPNEVSGLSGKEYDEAKRRLKCFCVGKFRDRLPGAQPEELEQVLVFDLDHIDSPEDFCKEHLQWAWIAFPSPSERGIRLILKATFSTLEERELLYFQVARKLSANTGLRLEEEVPKEERKTAPIINTSTRNINRLWFFTGISWFHGNQASEPVAIEIGHTGVDSVYVPVKREVPFTPARTGGDIEELVSELESRRIDIMPDYDSWRAVGLGMANELGEGGRSMWHRLSAIGPTYSYIESDKKYDNFIKTNKGAVTLATVFKMAQDAGVTVERKRSHERRYEAEKFNDRDAERMLVLFLARNSANYPEIMHRCPGLTQECFRHTGNRGMFQAVRHMSEKGDFIDPITVWHRVEGFMDEDVRSYTDAISLEQAVGYAETIKNLQRKSEMVRILTEAADAIAKGKDIDDAMSSVANHSDPGQEDTSIAAAIAESSEEFVSALKRMMTGDFSIPGRSTGLPEQDALCGGRQDGKLVVIAGRPGMGKSTQALCEAYSLAKEGHPVGYFSLEMPRKELASRLSCIVSGLSSQKRNNPMNLDLEAGEADMFMAADNLILSYPIHISEKMHMTAIVSEIRRLAAKGVKDFYIDYLGLMMFDRAKGQTDASAIGSQTATLKQVAKELHVSIVILVQLSRTVESRNNKRPQLSDLRDSGAIEQDADIVIFPFRPEYYGITEIDGYSTEGFVELIYAKHRGGPTGSIWVGADMSTFRFFSKGSRTFVPKKTGRALPSFTENDDEEDFPDYVQKPLF